MINKQANRKMVNTHWQSVFSPTYTQSTIPATVARSTTIFRNLFMRYNEIKLIKLYVQRTFVKPTHQCQQIFNTINFMRFFFEEKEWRRKILLNLSSLSLFALHETLTSSWQY